MCTHEIHLRVAQRFSIFKIVQEWTSRYQRSLIITWNLHYVWQPILPNYKLVCNSEVWSLLHFNIIFQFCIYRFCWLIAVCRNGFAFAFYRNNVIMWLFDEFGFVSIFGDFTCKPKQMPDVNVHNLRFVQSVKKCFLLSMLRCHETIIEN